MSTKLCQIVAVVNGVKSRSQGSLTKIYQTLQKGSLFEGMKKIYSPKDDEGEVYPSEEKIVQETVEQCLSSAKAAWTELFDVVVTQDVGNQQAVANIVVGEEIVLSNVPVTTLIFLEKQLNDIKAFVSHFPVLDSAKRWSFSEDLGCYTADPIERTKTKKKLEIVVAYPATPEHPAQIKEDHVDIVEGYWKTVEFSSAIPQTKKNFLIARVDSLIDAVKKAREEANSMTVEQVKIGNDLLSWLFK